MAKRTAAPKSVLLLVNADCNDTELHAPPAEQGPRRRCDFYELERVLDADVIDWSAVEASFLGRTVRRLSNWYLAAALLAFLRHRDYKLIWCLTEAEGAILALLLKLFRRDTPLMVICAVPTSRFMSLMIRRFRVQSNMTKLLPTQAAALGTLIKWGVPASKLGLLPYQVDADFFDPRWAHGVERGRPYVLAVGRQSRDFRTLVAAAEGLPVRVVIALGSLWAPEAGDEWARNLPANVEITTEGYVGLRDLYAGCAFVVVPLLETDIQNGVTSIQEAMAMGKAVIATRTRGQSDVLADARALLRDGSARATRGNFARHFAPTRPELHGQTGIYVPPGDVRALRAAMEHLLAAPARADELGRRGRAVSETIVSLDRYLQRICELSAPYLSGRGSLALPGPLRGEGRQQVATGRAPTRYPTSTGLGRRGAGGGPSLPV